MEMGTIGEKIHKLRIAAKMTQKELAGDVITRNMLSQIETGAALPSLPTMEYLANRLGVPAGFLLAEGDDDKAWRRMGRMESVRRAFRTGDFRLCINLCQSGSDSPDDEMLLMMAQSGLALAEEEMETGRLRQACRQLDAVRTWAEATMFDTAALRTDIALYFRFLHTISPQLVSEKANEAEDMLAGSHRPLGRFILAWEALQTQNNALLEAYGGEDCVDAYHAYIMAHRYILAEDYEKARRALGALLSSSMESGELLLYCIFCDMEIACRETGDFKGAYEYAQGKVTLLEKMLTQTEDETEGEA